MTWNLCRTRYADARMLHGSIMIKSLDHHWEIASSTTNGHVKRDRDGDEDGGEPDERYLEKLDEIVGEEMQQEDQDGPANDSSNNSLVGKGVNGRGKALLSTYEPDKRCESWLKVIGTPLRANPGKCADLF